jgi:hypothetical protein
MYSDLSELGENKGRRKRKRKRKESYPNPVSVGARRSPDKSLSSSNKKEFLK